MKWPNTREVMMWGSVKREIKMVDFPKRIYVSTSIKMSSPAMLFHTWSEHDFTHGSALGTGKKKKKNHRKPLCFLVAPTKFPKTTRFCLALHGGITIISFNYSHYGPLPAAARGLTGSFLSRLKETLGDE